jgi:hypothetical protein
LVRAARFWLQRVVKAPVLVLEAVGVLLRRLEEWMRERTLFVEELQ